MESQGTAAKDIVRSKDNKMLGSWGWDTLKVQLVHVNTAIFDWSAIVYLMFFANSVPKTSATPNNNYGEKHNNSSSH